MKSGSWLAVPAGLLGVLVGAFLFKGSASKAGHHATPAAETDPDGMAAVVDQAPPAPPALARRAYPRPDDLPAAPPTEAQAGATAPPAPRADPKTITSDEYNQFVAATFDKQPRDPAWSREAEAELTQSLVPLLSQDGSTPTRVDCRRDMCRFEVRNRDERAYQTAFTTTMHQMVWNAGMMLFRSPTDPTTLVVYLGKKGGGIPSPTSDQ
jgi:hypothetical protein